MKRLVVVMFSTIALLHVGQVAAESPNRMDFPRSGFSIAVLESVSSRSSYQALAMFLEPRDGFAPNVNVQIQLYTDTITTYLAITVEQFKDAGCDLIEARSLTSDTVSFEYSGEMHGNTLHWYGRAVKNGNKVYLVTGTSLESQWDDVSKELKRVVNSITVD